MRFRYPIPQTDDDFEHLGCELLRRHWNRPYLQRYAHKGEKQDGVDIFDPSQTKPIHGAQCKLHDYGKTIPPKEIEREVEKAKKHVPPLEHYAILTTGRKSKQGDQCVAEINRRHQAQGLFRVEVLTWDQITELLDKYTEVRDAFYNTLSGQTGLRIDNRLAAIQVAIESGPSLDAIDAELDGIKAELERYEIIPARRLSERLEEKHADRLSLRQRWRLLTLRASSYLAEGELHQAGTLFLKAKQYQAEDEKALVNEGVGHELIGEREKAHALAVALRQRFPHSSAAAALWVRTAPESISSDELDSEAGKFAEKETDAALALSICCANRDDFARADRYGKRATELDHDLPQAWLLLGQAFHARGFRAAKAEERQELLRQAEEHYSKTIELAHKQRSLHMEVAAYLNRGVVRELLAQTSASEDFANAKRLAPQDAQALRKYALHLHSRGRLDEAVAEAGEALKLEPSNESSVFLAGVLWDRNQTDDRQKALELCLQVVRGQDSERFDQALDIAVEGLCRFNRWDEAKSLLSSLHERLSEVARNVFLARIEATQGNKVEAEALARSANEKVVGVTTTEDLRALALLLVRLNLFALALPHLQRIANLSRFDPDTRTLLDCANRLRKHRLILDVCRALREAGEGDRRLLDNELDILQLYDRPAAIEVLQKHLARHPEDRVARLRLSLLGLQSERAELVTSDVNQLPPVEDAEPSTVGRGVVGVLERTGKWLDAVRYAYNLLRGNMDDPIAHLLYTNLILHGEREGVVLDSTETAQLGMAVAYKEERESQIHWVVIEEDEPDADVGEYAPSHPRVERLLGKKVGETFSLASSGIQERKGQVVSIVNKYVQRFRDCLQQFQVKFPERQDLQQVRLAKEGSEELDLAPVLASLDERRRHVSHVMSTYRAQPFPLHLVEKLVGRDLFETMTSLVSTPDAGIRWCCLGHEAERSEALAAGRENKTLVLDLTSLFTTWKLGLLDVLKSWTSRRLLISQSTFDKLRDIVDPALAPRARGYMEANDEGKYVFTEASEEALKDYRASLEQLLAFVRERCVITPVPETADLEPEHREKLTELFGRDGVESIVLGARTGNVLWTDDMTLAAMAREDFGSTRRVWTQALLHIATEEKLLDQDEFDRTSARLIGLGYSFTGCSPGIVLKAGSLASWNSEAFPLRQVIRHFRLETVQPQTKLLMAAHSIVSMFRVVDSPFTRQAFILAILNQFGSRKLAAALAEILEELFGVDALSAHEARTSIIAWMRGPLLLP